MLNKILVSDIETLRVLKVGEEKLLVIDCLKMTMPKWISKEEAKALRESDGKNKFILRREYNLEDKAPKE